MSRETHKAKKNRERERERERSEWTEGEQRSRETKRGERIFWCCMVLGTSISFFFFFF